MVVSRLDPRGDIIDRLVLRGLHHALALSFFSAALSDWSPGTHPAPSRTTAASREGTAGQGRCPFAVLRVLGRLLPGPLRVVGREGCSAGSDDPCRRRAGGPRAFAVLKENNTDHGPPSDATRGCAFKVFGDARGQRYGEPLLKAAIQCIRAVPSSAAFLEVAAGNELVEWLEPFGFQYLPGDRFEKVLAASWA